MHIIQWGWVTSAHHISYDPSPKIGVGERTVTTRTPQRSISHLHRAKYLNVKYRSNAPGQVLRLKGMPRTTTIQGFTLTAITGAEKT